jgi:hypothetical protein
MLKLNGAYRTWKGCRRRNPLNPAISCLGASRTPAAVRVESSVMQASEKPAQLRKCDTLSTSNSFVAKRARGPHRRYPLKRLERNFRARFFEARVYAVRQRPQVRPE